MASTPPSVHETDPCHPCHEGNFGHFDMHMSRVPSNSETETLVTKHGFSLFYIAGNKSDLNSEKHRLNSVNMLEVEEDWDLV